MDSLIKEQVQPSVLSLSKLILRMVLTVVSVASVVVATYWNQYLPAFGMIVLCLAAWFPSLALRLLRQTRTLLSFLAMRLKGWLVAVYSMAPNKVWVKVIGVLLLYFLGPALFYWLVIVLIGGWNVGH